MIKCFQVSQEPFIYLLNLLSTYNISGPVLKGIKNGKFSQGAHNLREEPGNFSDYTIKWLRITRIGQQHWTKAWNKLDVLFQRKCLLYHMGLLLWPMRNAIYGDLIFSHWLGKICLWSWSTHDRETLGLNLNVLRFSWVVETNCLISVHELWINLYYALQCDIFSWWNKSLQTIFSG